MKSRAIKTGKIKDKEERKYWEQLKRDNRIPDAYYRNEINVINLGGIL